jgi:hypothetical protein
MRFPLTPCMVALTAALAGPAVGAAQGGGAAAAPGAGGY